MESLLEYYNGLCGKEKLFKKVYAIDYYSGPSEEIVSLRGSNKFFIASLVYLNPSEDMRIFSIVELNSEWMQVHAKLLEEFSKDYYTVYKQIKNEIRMYYKTYTGKVLLFKSNYLYSKIYTVVEINFKDLEYFKDFHKVMEQNRISNSKWLNFFQSH